MLNNVDDRKMTFLQFRIAALHHLLEENFSRETPMVQLQSDKSFHYLAPLMANGRKAKPSTKRRVCTRKLVMKENRYVCVHCPEKIICVENCFKRVSCN